MAIQRHHYLSKPQVWGDERPAGSREVFIPVESVKVGDLVVFARDHRNAYEVKSIDHLTLMEGTPNAFPFIRLNCGETGANGAGFDPGETVTVLQLPPESDD
ncbi:hypothetical protein ACIQU6_34025 [Streptomyces sp. NPDC090442]|uniref:hypothetical protein n=1 Tax=Streptomyces sp. NPDC090442 TaxID=3365962 RepID=UPI00381B243E